MKKLFAVILALGMLAGLFACGKAEPASGEHNPFPFVYTTGKFSIRYRVEDGVAVVYDGWDDQDYDAPLVVPLTIDGMPIDWNSDDGSVYLRKVHCSELIVPEGIKNVCVDLFSAKVAKLSASVEVFEIGRGPVGRIEVDPANPYLSSIDGVLYNKEGTILLQYPTGSELKRYTIPDGVKEIAQEAIDFCRPVELREVVIPPSVTVFPELDYIIESYAYGLTFIVAPGSAAETYFTEQAQSEEYKEEKQRRQTDKEPFILRVQDMG